MSPPSPAYALITFFQTGELISLLCTFLTTKQVFTLVQTNKFLRRTAYPFLWRNADLDADHRVEMLYTYYDHNYKKNEDEEGDGYDGRVLLSMVAYFIKINRIRSLKAGYAFMSYYLDGVRQYLDSDNTQQQRRQQEIPHLPPSSWIPAHQTTLFSAPLPLIKQLNRLDVSLLQEHRFPKTFFAGLNDAIPLAPRLFQFMVLNADHLTSVSLRDFKVSTANLIDIRRLCRTISSLPNLAHLAINIPYEPPFSLIPTIFFSCPETLVSFDMTTTVYNDGGRENEHYFRTPQNITDPDFAAGPTPSREGQLFTRLRYLKLPQHRTGYNFTQLNLILSHCPALEEWANVPSILGLSGVPPQLGSRLHYPSTLLDLSTHPSRNCKGEVVAGTMYAIPENQLKSLDFRLFEDTSHGKPDKPAPFIRSLLRHEQSLVSISLVDINWIQSKSIKYILTTCWALTSLVFASSNTMRSCLTLEDAITESWKCTRLRELRLIVNLNRGCANEYVMLDKLYTQLGALEDLEILDLMSACRNRNGSKPYTETTMTCMLALHNPAANRQGFLQSLINVKNLRVLLGSFLLINQEMYAMVGEAEVRWILWHWRHLETIELISDRERRLGSFRSPPQIELLKQGRPSLRFCRTQTK